MEVEKRIAAINKKYLPVVELHKEYIELLEQLNFQATESIELTTSKAYVLTSDIKKTADILNNLKYTMKSDYNSTGTRKITRSDVIDILRDIDTNTLCRYEKLARSQYKGNRGHTK